MTARIVTHVGREPINAHFYGQLWERVAEKSDLEYGVSKPMKDVSPYPQQLRDAVQAQDNATRLFAYVKSPGHVSREVLGPVSADELARSRVMCGVHSLSFSHVLWDRIAS